MPDALKPGSVVGILGGGQLGRMLALAGHRLGVRSHIYCPDPHSPAFDVTPLRTVAAYDDEAALARFAAEVDVITYEFENVPARTAELLARLKPLRPGARALAVAQDRIAEKTFLTGVGVPVAPFAPVDSPATLAVALSSLGYPSVLKTTRLGYDGKGQRILRSAEDLDTAFAALEPKPLVLERFIPFEREISVIVARAVSGPVAAYDPAENLHQHHILKTSTVPATLSAASAAEAIGIATTIVNALEYVGVLGVEFFVLADGALLVNEIAPRVHNSGHWTEAVCITDQFEQHMRAVLGWPLGDPTRLADVVMENLVGDEIAAIPARLGAGQRPHAYGKTEARPGRKMGHITHVRRFGDEK
jgi:5-(carboxyamino)imidazole ribonucleotide synthase